MWPTMGVGLDPETSCITLTGQIRAADVPQLAAAMGSVMEEGAKITLDLSRATLLDSATLGQIVGFHMRCKGKRAQLVLRRPTLTVRDTLDVTMLSSIFTIED